MTRLKDFVQGTLETLIAEDPDIRKHFSNEQGQPLDSRSSLYQTRKSMLEEALTKAYDSRLKPYDKRTFFQKYVATPLRYAAAGLYGLGITTVALGGITFAPQFTIPALLPAFGWTGAGVASSLLADIIDTYSYIKSGQMKARHTATIAGEDLVTKPLAYLPTGITQLVDLYRGRRKFEAKIFKDAQPAIHDALSYAKGLFLDKVYATTKERKIVPLRLLKDERYAPTTVRAEAA